jgi:chromatin segregation and condensation protein Rec8/ScpA/Scc1 (kleisin family)
LDHLLTLARAQKVDLSEISLAALVDQLAAALRQAPAATPLGQKGGWVVMAAWLVQLRARLLLPADTPAQQHAAAEADQLRERLVALQEMQALAAWLEQRPQLGRDMFARGQPEVFGVSIETAHAPDVIEFLWASMALFDDTPAPDTATVYRPIHLDLHPVAEARARILRLLNDRATGNNRAAGAAATLRLGLHPHREPRTGQARRCDLGTRRCLHTHPRELAATTTSRPSRLRLGRHDRFSGRPQPRFRCKHGFAWLNQQGTPQVQRKPYSAPRSAHSASKLSRNACEGLV